MPTGGRKKEKKKISKHIIWQPTFPIMYYFFATDLFDFYVWAISYLI
jgi:hypothetical protein